MNPRIHHPAWYRLVGIIDEPTEKAALTERQFACMQPFATFQTAIFTVLCQENFWSIQARDAVHLGLIADITAKVFDERLRETPVSAFGLNFDYHRQTKLADVGQRLGERVALLRMGLDGEPYSAAQI